MFVDKVRVKFQAGDGGNGITSFRHEKSRPLGGPDGGDGGNGGDIILQASRNQNTLATYRYKKLLKAQDGNAGSQAKKHGKSGDDLIAKVPVGTVVLDLDGNILFDLTDDDEQAVIARGGKGGFGNAHFISSTRQAPRVAEKGEKGQQVDTTLELKMIADVGIVGLPNAGKSTLLSVISNAKPEIANYPFTTLTPNLGVVDIDKKYSLLFADIPGLIEGASKGKGLGDEFLRHIERTAVLIHLIDAYGDNISKDYKTILSELAAYQSDLSKKPQIVAFTKTEGMDEKQIAKAVAQLKKDVPRNTKIMAISSASKAGIDGLLRALQKEVEKIRKKTEITNQATKLPVIKLKDSDSDWHLIKAKNKYVVTGAKIERFAARTQFDDYHGQQRIRDIMRKMGIIAELERLEIMPDQSIQIGDPSLGEIKY